MYLWLSLCVSPVGQLPEPRGKVTASQPPTATSDGERATYTLTLGTLHLKISQPKIIIHTTEPQLPVQCQQAESVTENRK